MTNTNDLEFIREKIEESGLKIKHLAKKIGVSSSTLSSFLNGKRCLGLPAKLSLFRELKINEDDLASKVS